MSPRQGRRRKQRDSLDGGIVIWKPRGPSSRQVVNSVERQLGIGGVGHCGTLDPLASGVMVLLCGSGSKFQEWLTVHDKSYEATVWFGLDSDSGDAEGPIHRPPQEVSLPSVDEITSLLPDFIGSQLQVPPSHSAVRVDGKRAYQRAREGDQTPLEARPVRIDAIDLLELDGPRCRLKIDCGPGTYIRSLARDLGAQLAIPSMLMALRRTACGVHHQGMARRWDRVSRDDWLPLERLVEHMPSIAVEETEARRLAQGQVIPWQQLSPTPPVPIDRMVVWKDQKVVGIAAVVDGLLRPRRWLVAPGPIPHGDPPKEYGAGNCNLP